MPSKDMKTSIRSYLDDWVRHSHALPILLSVNEVFWNAPEGYVSVVTENCSRGSLKDLLCNNESLPEAALIPIIKDLLIALSLFHGKFYTPFRALSLRQILFTNRGDLKLSFVGQLDSGFQQTAALFEHKGSQQQRQRLPQRRHLRGRHHSSQMRSRRST